MPAQGTKERLMRAAEIVFARDGIHAARLRDIYALAEQRNPSALHYHFGSRMGLVEAIMLRHQDVIDAEMAPRLDALERRAEISVRDIIEVPCRLIATRLETPSGRDFLRIIPQLMHTLGIGVRVGTPSPITAQSRRVLHLLEDRLSHLPASVRRERLVVFTLMISSIFANRAQLVASGAAPSIEAQMFVSHATDVISGALCAPHTTDPVPPAE
jgi:AcrR family transcriptional regulator